jgi:hypothetical protein
MTALLVQRGIIIDIVKSRTSGTAPLMLHLDASGTRAPGLTGYPFHELFYEWTFGGITGTFTYGIRNTDKNKAFGPIACPMYDTAGTYTVTLTVTHPTSGTVATEEFDVTVTAADTTWAGTKTVCVNPVGDADFTGKPTGAQGVNDDSVASVLGDYAQSGDVRILWKRGCSFDVGSIGTPETYKGAVGMMGAYGTGANPIFVVTVSTTIFNPNSASDWRICDIEIDGTGFVGDYDVASVDSNSGDTNILFKGLRSVDHESGVTIAPNVATYVTGNVEYIFMYENDFYRAGDTADNFASALFCSSDHRLGIVGNKFGGIGAAVGAWPTRWSKGKHSRSSNNLYTNSRTNGSTFLIHASTYDKKSEYNVLTDDFYISNADGASACSISYTNTTTGGEAIENILIDSCWVQTQDHPTMMSMHVKYGTVRNCIFYVGAGTGGMTGIACNTTVGLGHQYPGFLWIYNNSFYFTSSTSNSVNGITTGGSTQLNFTPANTVIKNNLVCAPNAISTSSGFRKHETAGTVTESNNSTGTQTRDIDAADIWVNASGTWLVPTDYRLKAASYAIDAGTSVPVYEDAEGTVRTGTMDMGAFAYVP